MKHLINLKEFDTNEETFYNDLLPLTSVRLEIEAEIMELELSGTYYISKQAQKLKIELGLINKRLLIFNN